MRYDALASRVYLGLGSNLGHREENLQNAISTLSAIDGIRVKTISSCYQTEPVGPVTNQDDFYNIVAEIETTAGPGELLALIDSTERRVGRIRGERWGPRVIDIDILLWEDRVIDEDGLIVPHPELTNRAFVLVPLTEIAPDAIDPATRKSVAELASQLDDNHRVRRLDSMTFHT